MHDHGLPINMSVQGFMAMAFRHSYSCHASSKNLVWCLDAQKLLVRHG